MASPRTPRTSSGLSLFQMARFLGLNKRNSKFLIGDEQAQDILNFVFDERGALTKITGYLKWNASSVGAGGWQGGERFYRTGVAPEFVEAHGGKLYKGVDATKTFTEIASGLDDAAQVRMKINRDLLFIVNGVDENKKWDGTTVTKMGLTAPSSAPTAAAGAAGLLSGIYFWKVTFVSPTHESNGSPLSNSLNITDKQVDLTGIAVSADTQVTKRRIYRTLAGGTDLKYVGEINDNTTTTFTDNVADASLGSDIPTLKDPPPVNKFIEAFKNRLWLSGDPANPRRLSFSEYFEPEAWPQSYYVDIPMTPGDEITGVKILGDVLVVYGHNTPYLVIGESPFDFTVKRSFAQTGTESDLTVVLVENAHIYLSRFGVYAFDGAVGRLLTDDIDGRPEAPIRQLNQTAIGKSAATYHERTKLYRLAVPLNSAANNYELLYDLRNNAWTTTDRAIAYYHHLNGPGDNGELFSASPSAGYLYEEDIGTTADGAAFTAKWRSKAYTLGMVDFWKFLRHFVLWAEPHDDPITAEVRLDDDAGRAQTFTIPVTAGLARYGTATYGESVYGGPGIVRVTYPFLQKMSGNYVEFYLEVTTDSSVKIYSIEASYRSHGHLRIR